MVASPIPNPPPPSAQRRPSSPGGARGTESRDRDTDDDRPRATSSHGSVAVRRRAPGERQDEPGEVEVDGGQQDDRGREAERLDPEPVDDRERRTDRRKATGVGRVPDVKPEATGSRTKRIPAARAVHPVIASHGGARTAATGPAGSKKLTTSRPAPTGISRSTIAGGRDPGAAISSNRYPSGTRTSGASRNSATIRRSSVERPGLDSSPGHRFDRREVVGTVPSFAKTSVVISAPKVLLSHSKL